MSRALIATNICLGSIDRRYPMYCRGAVDVCERIIEVSHIFDYIFIVNDHHDLRDKELFYLPPHMIQGSVECYSLDNLEARINCTGLHYLKKNTLSALKSEHNIQLISSYKITDIFVGGFVTEMDVESTCIDLMSHFKNVKLLRDCTSGLIEKNEKQSINKLSWLGIQTIYNKDII